MGNAGSKELTADWGIEHFNPWDPGITYQNIWPIYKAMRDEAPVVHSDALGGFWSVTRYQEIRAAGRNYKAFSSKHALDIGKSNRPQAKPTSRLIETDPPDHTRIRKAMQEPILASRAGSFTEGIRDSVTNQLRQISEMGAFDVVTHLAEPIPQDVISIILGFDDETRQENRKLVLEFVHSDLINSKTTHKAFWNFLEEQVARKLSKPGDDFLSQLCTMEVDGQRFSEAELIGMVHGFALAGHHTSIDAISSMVRRLSDNAVKQALRKNPDLAPRMIEETLRLDPPIHLEGRTTTEETALGGVTIPAGESVALIYASGNRDEAQFDVPTSFQLGRYPNQHLSFGHGIHTCIGMHLAKLEMTVVMEELMKWFPSFKLAGESEPTGMVFGHHMGWLSMPAEIG